MTGAAAYGSYPPAAGDPALLRVGVIGLGVGRQHVAGYSLHPACRVVAVADLDADKLANIRREHPDIATTTSAMEVLCDRSIDVVSIASFDADHFDQVMTAMTNSKHVFVEKPLCQTKAQLKAIRTAWAERPTPVHMASNLVLRAAPAYRWLRDEVRSGRFGRLFAIDGDYLYGRINKITDGWRARTAGYSVMAAGGIHLLDLLLWITGERPTHVTAVGNRICTAGTAFSENDYIAATFCFPSGLIGRVSANFGCVHGHQHVLRIFGTDATFIHDDRGPRIQRHRDPAPAAEPLSLASLPAVKHALIGNFIDEIVAGHDTSAVTYNDFNVMAACLAADEAAQTGKNVEILY